MEPTSSGPYGTAPWSAITASFRLHTIGATPKIDNHLHGYDLFSRENALRAIAVDATINPPLPVVIVPASASIALRQGTPDA